MQYLSLNYIFYYFQGPSTDKESSQEKDSHRYPIEEDSRPLKYPIEEDSRPLNGGSSDPRPLNGGDSRPLNGGASNNFEMKDVTQGIKVYPRTSQYDS